MELLEKNPCGYGAKSVQMLVIFQFSFPQCKQNRGACPASYQFCQAGGESAAMLAAAAPDSELGFVQLSSCLPSFCYFLSSHCLLHPSSFL